MNDCLNILKLEAKIWYENGIGGRRDLEEIQAYLEGIQSAIMFTYKVFGQSDYYAYAQANTFSEKIDDYLMGLHGGQ